MSEIMASDTQAIVTCAHAIALPRGGLAMARC